MVEKFKSICVNKSLIIHGNDIEESYIRASGPGGQNVNKVATAVQLRYFAHLAGLTPEIYQRLMHIAGQRANKDGSILIEASRFRTQDRNRQDALMRLIALLKQAAEPPSPPRKKTKPSKSAIERRLQSKTKRAKLKKLRANLNED